MGIVQRVNLAITEVIALEFTEGIVLFAPTIRVLAGLTELDVVGLVQEVV